MTILSSAGQPVLPGDFAAVRTHSWDGVAIEIGEVLCRFPRRNPVGTDWDHAIFYLGGPSDLILEAEPGGAKVVPVHYRRDDMLWSSDRPALALDPGQRARAFELGQKYEGTPYSAADYFAIAAHRFGIRTQELRHYIEDTGHMICSVLVDQCRMDIGSHLFTDPPRWKGYVTPLDIAGLIGASALW